MLIEGETGTGKSVLAAWLHRNGPRAAKPFIKVNCAALPETLAESELFGHERGAFTDAKTARIGLFEAADGGTLFLDDIATLSPSTQAKVLMAVEDHAIRRLGATKEIRIDVRLIAASNEPLAELAKAGILPRGPLPPAEPPSHRAAAPQGPRPRHPEAREAPAGADLKAPPHTGHVDPRPATGGCWPTRGPATRGSWPTSSSAR
jgi:hypothetical protein